MATRRTRSQSAVEYVFLVAGALLFVVFVVVILRGGIFGGGPQRINETTNSFLTGYGHSYLCFDSFDAEVLDRYSVKSGSWRFNDRKLAVSEAQEGLVFSDCSLSNFSLSVWLKRPAASESVGIIFRARNESDHYNLTVNDANVFFSVNSTSTQIGATAPHGGNLASGILVRLDVYKNVFSVYVNGGPAPVLSVTDSVETYVIGTVGFYSSQGGTGYAEFDDLKACETPCQ